VHIRSAGNWTNKLYDYFATMQEPVLSAKRQTTFSVLRGRSPSRRKQPGVGLRPGLGTRPRAEERKGSYLETIGVPVVQQGQYGSFTEGSSIVTQGQCPLLHYIYFDEMLHNLRLSCRGFIISKSTKLYHVLWTLMKIVPLSYMSVFKLMVILWHYIILGSALLCTRPRCGRYLVDFVICLYSRLPKEKWRYALFGSHPTRDARLDCLGTKPPKGLRVQEESDGTLSDVCWAVELFYV
jgi:hypothetical protein